MLIKNSLSVQTSQSKLSFKMPKINIVNSKMAAEGELHLEITFFIEKPKIVLKGWISILKILQFKYLYEKMIKLSFIQR